MASVQWEKAGNRHDIQDTTFCQLGLATPTWRTAVPPRRARPMDPKTAHDSRNKSCALTRKPEAQ